VLGLAWACLGVLGRAWACLGVHGSALALVCDIRRYEGVICGGDTGLNAGCYAGRYAWP
jgi:hypothetical protein